jgi:hypothetical protein
MQIFREYSVLLSCRTKNSQHISETQKDLKSVFWNRSSRSNYCIYRYLIFTPYSISLMKRVGAGTTSNWCVSATLILASMRPNFTAYCMAFVGIRTIFVRIRLLKSTGPDPILYSCAPTFYKKSCELKNGLWNSLMNWKVPIQYM